MALPNDSLTLCLDGDLTIENAAVARDRLAAWMARGENLTLDLSAVKSCDTAGLQLICAALKSAAQSGKSLRMSALPPAVESVAAALGLPLEGGSGLAS